MRGSSLAVVALSIAACRNTSSPPSDGGIDAPPSPYSISLGAPNVIANGLTAHTVSITGLPNDDIVIDLDRGSAGALDVTALTLDEHGK